MLIFIIAGIFTFLSIVSLVLYFNYDNNEGKTIWGKIKRWSFVNYNGETLGITINTITIIVAALFWLVLFVVSMVNITYTVGFKTDYQSVSAYIEASKGAKNLSQDERLWIMKSIVSVNERIIKNKNSINNPCFIYLSELDAPLIDLSLVPEARYGFDGTIKNN
jgi:hypothetical protein